MGRLVIPRSDACSWVYNLNFNLQSTLGTNLDFGFEYECSSCWPVQVHSSSISILAPGFTSFAVPCTVDHLLAIDLRSCALGYRWVQIST